MKSFTSVMLSFFLYSSATFPTASEKWIVDVKYFGEQLVKRHKNAFHHVSKTEFDSDVSELIEDVPKLEEYQVIVRLMQITAKIGDGHTAVHTPATFKRYPIVVNWFGDELYVNAATEPFKAASGGKVSRIGDMDIDEVNRRLRAVITQDQNKWCEMYMSAAFIMRPEILVTLGIVPAYDHAVFTFQQGDEEIKLDLPVIQIDPKSPFISASKTAPLFRQKQSNPFWFSYVENINAVFLSFKNYDDLNKNSDELFDFIHQRKANRLIIDLRFNGGGDFKKGRRLLLSKIKEDALINQKGNLFVITGRGTYSAAMVNAIDFKKETNAIILGEPPGERPNTYSENDEFTLPNSGLVVSYSTEYYKFLDEDVMAFEPDIRIDPTWADFSAGKDAVMEWIVQYCKEKR